MLVCDVGGGTTDFSLIAVGRTRWRSRRSSASPSASTSCSAATTWISRSRACSSSGSRRRPQGRHLAASRPLAPGAAREGIAALNDPSTRERPVTLLGRGSKPDRRHDHDDADARRREPDAARGILSACQQRGRCRRGSGGSGCRKSACPTPPIPPSRRHLARFLGVQAICDRELRIHPPRAERTGLSDARALQRRRDEGRRAPRTGSSTC